MSARFPKRCPTHNNRLHRNSSLRHDDSNISSPTTIDGIMEPVAGSPRPTPVIVEGTEFSAIAPRSTPCPVRVPTNLVAANPENSAPTSEMSIDGDDYGIPATPWEELNRRENDRILQAAGVESERSRLRNSIARLQERLDTSSATVNRLQTRNDIHQADADRRETELSEIRDARDSALHRVKASTGTRNVLTGLICLILAFVLVYSYVCWYQGPEMSYIRKRRCEILDMC